RRVPRDEHHTHEWNGTGLHDLDELAEAELAGGKPRQHGEALVRRVPHGHRALGALDHAVAREAARERARLGHERGTIAPRPPPAQALARPETLSRVGTGRERVASVDRVQVVPRPAKPARQTLRPWAAGLRRAADTSSRVTRSRSGRSPAPALPAAARRGPCVPGGILGVRPRPEMASRVGALALHRERELAAIARAGHGLPLGARAPSRAYHADRVLERDAARAAVALERGAEREQLRVAAPERGHALQTS